MNLSDEHLQEIIQLLLNLDWTYVDSDQEHLSIEKRVLISPKRNFKFKDFEFKILKVDWVKFLPLRLDKNYFTINGNMAIFSETIALNLANC